MTKGKDNFRVYRVTKEGHEQRQDMIVGHPERGWVCATETSDNRAKQWAHIYSSNDSGNTYEVRELREVEPEPDAAEARPAVLLHKEFTILRYRNGRSFL